MRHIFNFSFLLLLVSSLLLSCDLKDNELRPTETFVRIYETGEFERAYVPLDVQPTGDGGYIILAGANVPDSDFMAAYLLKVDEEGGVEWEHLSEEYVNPVSELIPGEDADYFTFFGMDKQQLGTHMVQVVTDSDSQVRMSSVAYFGSYNYPLAAAAVPNGFAVLHWNRDDKSSMQLSRLSKTATQQWKKSYAIYEDVESQIMAHLTRQRHPLIPFMVGATPNGDLFFNGFNNFTLSLTFVKGGDGEQTGVLNGNRYSSGISQVIPLAGGEFAASSFKVSGENIYSPSFKFASSEVASAKDLSGNQLPELTPYAKVKIRQLELNEELITFFASNTRNGQIVIFAYDEEGILRGTKYLGAGNRFETGSLTATVDGGLIVVGRVFMAGRFPRLCLFKMSPHEVIAFVK